MPKIDKGLYWIVGGQLVSLGGNFLLLKLLTTQLSMDEYGYYVLWASVVLFFRQLIYDSVSIVAAKESVVAGFLGVEELSGFQVVRYMASRAFLFLLIPPMIVVLTSVILNINFGLGLLLLAGIIYLASNGAQGVYINIMNIRKERDAAARGVMMDSVFKLVVIYLIFIFKELDLVLVSVAIAVSSFVTFLFVDFTSKGLYKKIDPISVDFIGLSRKVVLLSAPLLASTFLVALKGIGDKIFMASFIGVQDLAAYNVLFQLGFIPMILIIGVLQTYLSPDIYRQASDEAMNPEIIVVYINNLMYKIVYFGFFCAGVSYVLAYKLFDALVGAGYLDYSQYLPLFVLAGVFSGGAGILNIGVVALLESKRAAIIILVSVFSSLLLLIALIWIGGFEGGVSGIVVSNLLMLIIYFMAIKLAFRKGSK